MVVEQTGAETLLLLDMHGQKLTYLGRERLHVRPGETVRVLPDFARLHIFDARTSRRLA